MSTISLVFGLTPLIYFILIHYIDIPIYKLFHNNGTYENTIFLGLPVVAIITGVIGIIIALKGSPEKRKSRLIQASVGTIIGVLMSGLFILAVIAFTIADNS